MAGRTISALYPEPSEAGWSWRGALFFHRLSTSRNAGDADDAIRSEGKFVQKSVENAQAMR